MIHLPKLQRFSAALLFCVYIALLVYPLPSHAAAADAQPRSALLDVTNPTETVLSLAFAMTDVPQTFLVPAGVSVSDGTAAAALFSQYATQYPLSVTDASLLRFGGNLEPTAIPTITPFALGALAADAGSANPAGAQITLPAGAAGAHVVWSFRCAVTCAADWYVGLLRRLPAYAPVYAIGQAALTCPGLATVQAVQAPQHVVTVLSTLEQPPLGVCQALPALPTAVTPPVRTITVDGTMTLLRLVFCLIAVLLLSIGSFYGALALTKRMHAAVGFRPEDR